MDGILIIDKPAGVTSHDVVNRLRRTLKTKRVGHTGTLDPFATGVLVLLIGRATRLARFLDKDEKEYDAVVRFGFETDTGDNTGKPRTKVSDHICLTQDDIEKVLPQFRGRIEQLPPMYSAKKVAGKKLYEHARRGVEIERKAVPVNIRSLEITTDLTDDPSHQTSDIGLSIVASAGTYIRTLAEDIGRAVGAGAHLAELRRTRAGRFGLSESVTLAEFEKLAEPSAALIEMQAAVEHLQPIALDRERAERTKNGLATRSADPRFVEGEPIRMLSESGELIAIGFYDANASSILPKVVLG